MIAPAPASAVGAAGEPAVRAADSPHPALVPGPGAPALILGRARLAARPGRAGGAIELAYDVGEGFRCVCPQGDNGKHSCDHRNLIYGTAGFVTGSFGFACASQAVRMLLG